jgi:hypothetical protein
MEPSPCPIVRVILTVSIDHLAAAQPPLLVDELSAEDGRGRIVADRSSNIVLSVADPTPAAVETAFDRALGRDALASPGRWEGLRDSLAAAAIQTSDWYLAAAPRQIIFDPTGFPLTELVGPSESVLAA